MFLTTSALCCWKPSPMNRRKVENVYVVIDTDIDDVIGMRGRNSNFDFESCPVTSSIATTMAPLTHPSIQDGWFGSDGGVVREVLKHDSAVIRASKQYLPHVSSLLSSANVTVSLETVSSSWLSIKVAMTPLSPTLRILLVLQSLFQKPYFQLLHDALAPGDDISTQGTCLVAPSTHLPAYINDTRDFSCLPVRLHDHPHLPFWSERLHSLFQGT
ncbi:uncharacterized protein BT62DRAFT_462822 [Guyanagaster necrorhizus]|uniref:Uncharacterized protein n=1 Tax=Guyanagaster necrorhizus TaxID=856835 RepID=A0A9P7VL97_9AGAR|nr:uncharacterized protein BT62DRAFT_462822 [Guyanagaster necrorhizus MCA 3950]KAG7441989.1 hypothetical protein BT62DRAFT_462822 [Guyanagaster necrorhizus MCA 3950]